jgi:hypothetical protein
MINNNALKANRGNFKNFKKLVSIDVIKRLLKLLVNMLKESFGTCKNLLLKHFKLYNKFYEYILNDNTQRAFHFTINFTLFIYFHLNKF